MLDGIKEFVQEIKLKPKVDFDKDELQRTKDSLNEVIGDFIKSGNVSVGGGMLLSKQLQESFVQAKQLEKEFRDLTKIKQELEKVGGNKYAKAELDKIEARLKSIKKDQGVLAGEKSEATSFKDLIEDLQDKNIDNLQGAAFVKSFFAKRGAEKLFGDEGIFKNMLSKEKSWAAGFKRLKKVFDAFLKPLKNLFSSFINKLRSLWTDIWKDMKTAKAFDSTSSKYDANAISMYTEWGLKDGEAYATYKALEAMGISDYETYLEANAIKGGALEGKFQKLYDLNLKEYEAYQEAGKSFTDLEAETNTILREFKEYILNFIVENKDTIKAVLEGILTILKGILSFISTFASWLFGNARTGSKSYDEAYADIATKYSTTNNNTNSGNTLNVNVNNTGANLNPSTIINPLTNFFGSIGVGFKGSV